MQKSAAGHILLILDEVNKPLKGCTIWLENESYVVSNSRNACRNGIADIRFLLLAVRAMKMETF